MHRTKLTVSPLFQSQLKAALLAVGNPVEKVEQNCLYRLDYSASSGWVRAKQFTNGTFYLEATDENAFHTVLAVVNQVTGQTSTPIATAEKPAPAKVSPQPQRGLVMLDVPYVGTDESGKGDYFGPLVIAGVYTTPDICAKLKTLGVMDSKLLKDQQMVAMANQIKEIVGANAWNVIEIGPKRYNELYEKFKNSGKNLNHLLAWGHAKVLENLLQQNPDCTHAIADQFGSEHYIRSQLQTLGKQITLHQTPKAEANVGVAAASILARVRFVQKMDTLGKQFGISLPFGASAQVSQRARELIQHHGPQALGEVAKLHFKTTQALLANT